jgi:hypothetical protein
MPHVCLQHLLGGPASEPNPLRYTDFASSEQSIPSFSSPPHTRSHSKPIARKFQNRFLQEAVSKTLRRSAFPPARDSPRRSVPDTALTLSVPGGFALAPPVRIAESAHHSSGAFAPEPERYGTCHVSVARAKPRLGDGRSPPIRSGFTPLRPCAKIIWLTNEFYRRSIHRRHAAEKREKARLSAALRRLPIQCMFKLSRDRRSIDIAGENFTIRCIAAV